MYTYRVVSFMRYFMDCSLFTRIFINQNYTSLGKYSNLGPHKLCDVKVTVLQRWKGVLSLEKMGMSEERCVSYKRADITDGTVVKCGRNII